jgi:uncharacterized protein (TIGR02246 family)
MKATPLFIALVIAAALSAAANTPPPEDEIKAAVQHFLHAFEDLDMPSFIRCFAEDASVFFPVPEPAKRFDGKKAIQAHFEEVFAAIRTSSVSAKPPFHRLIPEDLQVQLLGGSNAVVTFQMSNAVRIARRTLVLEKRDHTWFIVHLHASNVALSAEDAVHLDSKP